MRSAIVATFALLLATGLPAQQASHLETERADSAIDTSPRRRQLERRLHDRLTSVVRDRLHLTQDQVDKLGALNQRYAEQRRALAQRERSLRFELRQQLRRADSADQKRVAELLDQALQAQQARLDLYRNEQSDLSAFLTPVQRAQYMGLQEQVRDRVDDLRRKSSARRGRARPGDQRPSTAERPGSSPRDR
jgi:Spy/CpxP family protein refolding chaperone